MADVLRSLRLGGRGDPARACALALGAEGVALSLLVGNGRMAEPLWCHPEVSARFEELQFTLGEGPGPDAVRTGSPVMEPDLDRVRPDRWPALLPPARDLGVHGVCCFPLGIGAIRLGVLTVLCDGDRTMSVQQSADATALAAALTGALLNGDGRGQRGEDGNGNGDRGGSGNGGPVLGLFLDRPTGLHRAAVHQATGMISVQLGVTMEEALLRLRAHAYGSERPLGEVADDVVARRLRFNNSDDTTNNASDNGDGFDDDMNGPYSPGDGKG
ncbi:ANTAR domain-containing protein [Streptomyces umbrinus]|uniref:ANTAR domain-containing protein n=1 Tax=Streptomyces umbrinus TaxID=67370 RepID=UPI00216B0CF3|nr:ANTAR domain-containing protein [Streptomyces umbrinus]MCX4559271.1 ANTAR domain-containing protein [Streptomyces phaeochromogenes]